MTAVKTITAKWAAGLTAIVLVVGLALPGVGAQEPTPALPQVQIVINPPVVTAGQTVSVSASLVNFNNLYGIQVNCSVDPSLLAGLGRADGDVFNAGNSFFVDEGLKADGNWLIAATRLQPAPPFVGNGTAFSFQYNAQAVGISSVTCAALASNPFSVMLPLEVQGAGVITINPVAAVETVVPLPTALPTIEVPAPTDVAVEPVASPPPLLTEVVLPTDVIEPTATIVPTEKTLPTPTVAADETEIAPVPAAPAIIQGTAAYAIPGTQAGINAFLTVDGNLLGQVVTGDDGVYRFSDVPAGTYTILLSAIEHLSVAYTVTVTGDGTLLDLGSVTLIPGDTDGNQIIDLADSSLVTANFDQPSPPAPESADLNHDGQVNVADLVLIGMNYGRSGPIVMR